MCVLLYKFVFMYVRTYTEVRGDGISHGILSSSLYLSALQAP